MYEQYREHFQFYIVYIREAHPSDGWSMKRNVSHEDPETLQERRDMAKICTESMNVTIPCLVDHLNDSEEDQEAAEQNPSKMINDIASISYNGWPERLYVITQEGKVSYQGGMGPFDFNTDELADFLKKEVEE